MPNTTEMIREMLELQLQNDKQVQNYKEIDYSDIKGRYFYAFLENLGNYNMKGKTFWCWWKDIPRKKNIKAIQRNGFAFITSTILSYALALSDGDIEKIMELFPIYPDKLAKHYNHNPSKLWITSLMIQFATPQSASVHDLLKIWMNLFQSYHFDFEKDVYEPYKKLRSEHSYLNPQKKLKQRKKATKK